MWYIDARGAQSELIAQIAPLIWLLTLKKGKSPVLNANGSNGPVLCYQCTTGSTRHSPPLEARYRARAQCTVDSPPLSGPACGGARDALLFLILSWILALANGSKIGVYCSDVAGA